MENKSFEELYMEYLELKKAKEEAENKVIKNMIQATVKERELRQQNILNELELMNRRLDLISF